MEHLNRQLLDPATKSFGQITFTCKSTSTTKETLDELEFSLIPMDSHHNATD